MKHNQYWFCDCSIKDATGNHVRNKINPWPMDECSHCGVRHSTGRRITNTHLLAMIRRRERQVERLGDVLVTKKVHLAPEVV